MCMESTKNCFLPKCPSRRHTVTVRIDLDGHVPQLGRRRVLEKGTRDRAQLVAVRGSSSILVEQSRIAHQLRDQNLCDQVPCRLKDPRPPNTREEASGTEFELCRRFIANSSRVLDLVESL